VHRCAARAESAPRDGLANICGAPLRRSSLNRSIAMKTELTFKQL
jgi:hypothetical protein